RPYKREDAERDAIRLAFSDALDYFWTLVDTSAFAELCAELLRAEDIDVGAEGLNGRGTRIDLAGDVVLDEPAGFRRLERWGFEVKHHLSERVSAEHLRQVEQYLARDQDAPSVVCLLTSGDLTSIGSHIAVENPRIRVWDREILNHLLHQHVPILTKFFGRYSTELVKTAATTGDMSDLGIGEADVLREALARCLPGLEHSLDYERLGTSIWSYLFADELDAPKSQVRTSDGTQRRDVLFRNKRNGPFFRRIADQFGAYSLIVDFKNYSGPIGSKAIEAAAKYANEVIGRFVVVVSRRGPKKSVLKTQHRILRNNGVAVLVVSDDQLIEMLRRKEDNQNPADVLEDILEVLIYSY
ncbi:MAG: restriction endonuclease, partial [Bacillota bacterium]